MSEPFHEQTEPQEPAQVPTGPLDKKKIGFLALAGVIALLVAVELLSHVSKSTRVERAPIQTQQALKPSPASKESIRNFERQTQQEALDLARLQAQKEALDNSIAALAEAPPPNGATDATVLSALRQQQAAIQQQQIAGYVPTPATGANEIAKQELAEQKKREAASLRASNVALDLRSTSRSPVSGTTAEHGSGSAESRQMVPPTEASPVPPIRNSADTQAGAEEKPNPYPFNSASGKSYRLFEGRIIETVLTNRINGALSGPIDCMVTTDVYSHDHQNLLIPQGARVIGRVSAVNGGTQQRLFVAFHRIIMPDGYSVQLDSFAGLNVVGETGLRDIVNHHYLQIFGASLALAAIGGVAQIGSAYSGIGYDPMIALRAGVSRSMGESAHRVLDHFLNQLPTFIIRERARVKIYLSNDLLLPAYAKHTMPSDL